MTITGITPATVLGYAGDILTAFMPIVLLGLGVKFGSRLLSASKKAG